MDEIRAAYRRLARVHHPDAGGSEEAFKVISAAYAVLGQPHRRAGYDEWLRNGQPKPAVWVADEPAGPRGVDAEAITAVLIILAALGHYVYVVFFSQANLLDRLVAVVILPPVYCIGIGVVIYLVNRS